jgi:uncharacterized protein (DUF1330 family)
MGGGQFQVLKKYIKMGNKQNSCTNNYSTRIKLKVIVYFPDNTRASIWYTSDGYVKVKETHTSQHICNLSVM